MCACCLSVCPPPPNVVIRLSLWLARDTHESSAECIQTQEKARGRAAPPSRRLRHISLPYLGRAVVVDGHKGHLRDRRVRDAPANRHFDRGTSLGERLVHVAHRDVLLEHRREAATGHLADDLAVGVEDLRVLARGRAGRDEADAALRDAVGELRADRGAAEEGEVLAPPLADGPGEARLNGRARLRWRVVGWVGRDGAQNAYLLIILSGSNSERVRAAANTTQSKSEQIYPPRPRTSSMSLP